MFSKFIVSFILCLGTRFAVAEQKFDGAWKVSGDHYVLKSNAAVKVVFSISAREPAAADEKLTEENLNSQLEEFKKSRKTFGSAPKITDWKVAGSGVEEDGVKQWVLLEGSFKKPSGETEKFYEIHYYKAGKLKVAAIHYPAKTSEADVAAAVKTVRDRMAEE